MKDDSMPERILAVVSSPFTGITAWTSTALTWAIGLISGHIAVLGFLIAASSGIYSVYCSYQRRKEERSQEKRSQEQEKRSQEKRAEEHMLFEEQMKQYGSDKK